MHDARRISSGFMYFPLRKAIEQDREPLRRFRRARRAAGALVKLSPWFRFPIRPEARCSRT